MSPFRLLIALALLTPLALKGRAAEESKEKITHSFLACGNETFILDGSGKVTWKYPHSSRDGWVLANGNVLLALSKSKMYPSGAIAEVTREGKIVFELRDRNPK